MLLTMLVDYMYLFRWDLFVTFYNTLLANIVNLGFKCCYIYGLRIARINMQSKTKSQFVYSVCDII